MINIIVAVDDKYGIGKDGNIPWKCSRDLKRFKANTRNSYLMMGSKTFDTLPVINLDYRRIMIISSKKNKYDNLSFSSIEKSIEWYNKRNYYKSKW